MTAPATPETQDGITTDRPGWFALAREWLDDPPTSPEAVAAFYRRSAHLGDDLAEWHQTDERRQVTALIVHVAGQTKPKTVLDVGAGLGHDILALKAADSARLVVAVEPNDRLRDRLAEDFLARGFSDWSVARSLDADVAVPAPARFDLVLCIDVLEHLPAPKAFVADLAARVAVGGWLVEATGTTDVRNPTHLPGNWGWNPNGQLRGLGFALRHTEGRVHFWERTAERGVPAQTIICCAYRAISPETAQRIHQLGVLGWNFIPVTNDALISRARSQALAMWWRETDDDVCLMVDADITFTTEDAERVVALAREKRSIAVGAYPVRDGGHLSSRIHRGDAVLFAPDAPARVIEHGATGFMAIHRDVVDALIPTLPLCHPDQDWSFWPFFDCFVINPGQGDCQYLSEDWAFTTRARRAGFDVWLDPRIRLGHLGLYEYRLEDMTPEARALRTRVLPAMEIYEGDARELAGREAHDA